jgi:hypothetical protein
VYKPSLASPPSNHSTCATSLGVSELIGSVNLVFVVQLVGFRRLRFGLGHISGCFGSKTSVSIGN